MDSTYTSAGSRARSAVSRLGYWLVPDLALLIAIFTLFFCLTLFDGPAKLFRDSDSGWHIRAGEKMLASGALPRSDPYSLLRRGEPWFAWEWGADVLMGATHRAAGLAGVALLYAGALAVCAYLWIRLQWTAGGTFLLACLFAAPMLSTSNIHWLARPHVFSWIFLLGVLLYLERGVTHASGWVAAAFVGALWANLHASFFFGPLLVGMYACGRALTPLVWRSDANVEWRAARNLLFIAAGLALGTFINPYGWQLHSHVASYLLDRELLVRVGEFQSFNFHAEGSAQILFTILISGAGALLSLSQRNLPRCFVTLFLMVVALRSARALPILALLALPLANASLTRALELAGGLQPSLRRWLDGALRYSDNLRSIDRRFRGWALAPLALLLAFAWMRLPAVAARTGFPPGEFPVEAANHLPAGPGVRLLAPDKFGGYLIYRFNGRLPVYFDGRSDFYGSQYMKDYLQLIEVRPGWREQFDRIGFTHALLPNRYSLIPALEQAGWRMLYKDGTAALLAAPGR